MQKSLITQVIAFTLSAMLLASAGCSRSDVLKPTEGVIAVHQPGDSEMSCEALDTEIGLLYQQAMAMAPKNFASDPLNQGAMVVGTFVFSRPISMPCAMS